MGQTLSEPVRDKHTTEESDLKSSYGASSMQGWRISMEDAHTTIVKLPNRAPAQPSLGRSGARGAIGSQRRSDLDPDDQGSTDSVRSYPIRRDIYSKSPPAEPRQMRTSTDPTVPGASPAGPAGSAEPSDTITTANVAAEVAGANTPALFDNKLHISFYAVYDGHGGASVAQYAGKRLHWKIAQQEEFGKGNYEIALKKGFMAIDDELRDDPDFQNDPSGCTAVAALVTDDDFIYVANAGDSRCILSADGKAVAMSEDHKPGNPEESARIMRGGGFVEYGRVNGNLALSRALGDFEFKQNPSLPAEEQVVTSFPDVVSRKVAPTDEFLVLACDGIWDVLDNQQVCDFVSKAVAQGKSLGVVCEDLMDRCLAPDRRASELGGIGCDNMTVVVVALLKGKSFPEWALAVKERWNKYVAELGHDPVVGSAPQYTPADEHSESEDDTSESIGGFTMTENGEFVLQTPRGAVVVRTVNGPDGMSMDVDEGMGAGDHPMGMAGAQVAGVGRFEEVEEDGQMRGHGGENDAYRRSGSD
ncbi:Protein phosphatase 2C 2 [Gonapodya sp. JEL0774]|nr:Protein phosphatase 2C 2 [Gonapodya sp. JEL0774]